MNNKQKARMYHEQWFNGTKSVEEFLEEILNDLDKPKTKNFRDWFATIENDELREHLLNLPERFIVLEDKEFDNVYDALTNIRWCKENDGQIWLDCYRLKSFQPYFDYKKKKKAPPIDNTKRNELAEKIMLAMVSSSNTVVFNLDNVFNLADEFLTKSKSI